MGPSQAPPLVGHVRYSTFLYAKGQQRTLYCAASWVRTLFEWPIKVASLSIATTVGSVRRRGPMSKRGSPLVNYASSDDEGIEVEPEGPPKKKK